MDTEGGVDIYLQCRVHALRLSRTIVVDAPLPQVCAALGAGSVAAIAVVTGRSDVPSSGAKSSAPSDQGADASGSAFKR